MRLDRLTAAELSGAAGATEITALAYDSRSVTRGTLFFCVPGFRCDGHEFAAQAVQAGAAALVVERPLDVDIPQVRVESVRAAMAPMAARFYGDPGRELRVVGVTGTNGKTTSAYLVRALLEAAGEQCGLLGTVKSVIGGQEREVARTTAEAIDLQADLRAMLDGGDRACAMEVSSHALELGRTDAIGFAAAIFTNLTQDHLDFHARMEEYFQAKRRLFVPPAAPAPAISVINVDDPYGRRLAAEIDGARTFALSEPAEYRASEVRCAPEGCSFTLSTPEGQHELVLAMPGRFNVANALGALAAAHALGVELDVLVDALARGVRVPGRFEPVDEGQEFAVLVDYAHTPDSLENVLGAARELVQAGGGRVLCVFGAGGDRDRGKRPLMGAIAARLADVTIVTSDNPRSEDPELIIEEIMDGVPAPGGEVGSYAGAGVDHGADPHAGRETERVRMLVDRRAAIEAAISCARRGDVVVIAGKGHEQGQELAGGRKVPFDDVTVARETLGAVAHPKGHTSSGGTPLGAQAGRQAGGGREMRDWDASRVARAAGAELVAGSRAADAVGPSGVGIDSRALASGELFVGLRGEHADGGAFAAQALAAGAWGVLVAPEHAAAAVEAAAERAATGRADGLTGATAPERAGVVLAHEDPLAALHALALAWRKELRERGAKVVAITGSTGKTSTKDILAALLGVCSRAGAFEGERRDGVRVAASPANFNTEIGLPLALLGARSDVEVLVLEMAMRGPGQIAQLTAIAQPDVGVIVNVGPAHLELLGTLEAIAAAKAELIAGLAPGASVVVPAGESLLAGHLREDLRTITFGEGADVELAKRRADGSVLILHGEEEIELWPSFAQAHNLRNLLAAVAAARALGYTPRGRVEVSFSVMRGQREQLAGGAVLVDDCYNANPMSMRAAIDDLAETAPARRVAVLGDMLELGPEAARLHREIGEHASARGVGLLVTVGPLAAQMSATFAGETHTVPDAAAAAGLVGGLLREGDTVLVKGSRGVGLERVAASLRAGGEQREDPVGASAAAPGRR